MPLTVPDDTAPAAPAAPPLPATIPARFPRLVALQKARAALQVAAQTKPDDHATALKIGDQMGVPPAAGAAVVRTDPAKAKALAEDHDGLIRRFPNLARWMGNPDHAAVGQDDVPALAEVAKHSGLADLFGTDLRAVIGRAAQGPDPFAVGVLNTRAGFVHAAVARGLISPETGAKWASDLKRRAAEIDARKPESAKAFSAEVAQAGPELPDLTSDAWVKALSGGYAVRDDFGLHFRAAPFGPGAPPPSRGGLAGQVRDTAETVADVVAAAAKHPGGALYTTVENLPFAAPAMLLGAAGAVSPLPGGFATGTFAGSYLAEYGGWIDQRLGERQVDQTDEAALLAAYRDPGFMESAASEANRKALGTAGVDALFSFLAGHRLAKGITEGAGAGAIIRKGVREVGEQIGGEMASEGMGELAARGKIDLADVVLEGLLAGPQAAGEVAIGTVGRIAHGASPEAVQGAVAGAQAVVDEARDTATAEAVAGSKVTTRRPEAVRELVEPMTTPVPQTRSVPVEAWDAHWTALGKSPAEAAERITASPTAYQEARTTGSLSIPYARYIEALATDPDVKALQPQVVTRPGGVAPAEADSLLANLQGEMEQAAKAAEEKAAATPAPEDVEADEARAAELVAALGLPPEGDLLFQSATPEPAPEGEAAPPAEAKPEAGNLAENRGTTDKGIVPQPGDALRKAAAAIESVPAPGLLGKAGQMLTGAQPVAEVVRAKLGGAETGAAGVPDSGARSPREAGVSPPVEAIAQAAQRDPAGTAANLRELADIRDRQAEQQGPELTLRAQVAAAARAAGRPAAESQRIAAVVVAFVRTMESRYPAVAADFWKRYGVQFAASKAPTEGMRQQAREGKPPRAAYDPATRTIHFFEGADPSSALHEAAHWMRAVLADLAALPDAPEALKADAAAAAAVEEEEFARSFEAYVREGVAPSAALRRVFAAASEFLRRAYANVRALIGADAIAPELRAVFDRLLATDAEIDAATAEASLQPLMPTEAEVKAAGVDPKVAESYMGKVRAARDDAVEKLTRVLMRETEAAQKAKRAARLEELRADTAARIEELPATIALKALQAGPGKLSAAEVADVFSETPNVVTRLRKLEVLAEDGMPLMAAADAFGFTSPADLVDGVLLASNRDKLVEAVAAKRLANESPELLQNREALRAEARAAVITRQREEVVEAELRILLAAEKAAAGMRLTVTLPSAAEVRARAQAFLARKPIRDIKPSTYLAAVTRAGIDARQHFRAGNTSEVIAAKKRQQMNLALYREALAMRDKAQAHAKRLNVMHKPAAQETLGRAGPTHVAAMNKLLGSFSFRMGSLAAADRATARQFSLTEYVRAQQEAARTDQGIVAPELPPALVKRADEPAPVDWRNLTLDELTDLRESADQLLHIARTKNTLRAAQEERDLAAVVDPAREQIRKRPAKQATTETPTALDKRLEGIASFAAAHRTIDSLARSMDGDQPGGPVREALVAPKNAIEAAEVQMGVEAAREWRDRNRIFTVAERVKLSRPVAIPGLPRRTSRENAMMVALYWGSAEGRDRLFNTYTKAQIETILSTLTDKEVEFVNRTWAADEARWPKLKALGERLYGVAPPAITPLAYTLTRPDGTTATLTGGHTKLYYAGRRADEHSEADIAALMRGGAYGRHRPKAGSLIERVEHFDQKLRLDFGVLAEATTEDIHMLSHMEGLKQLDRTMSRLQDDIIEHWGKPVAQQFRKAYEDMAKGTIGATGVIQRSLGYLRTGTVIARIGFNLSSAAMNLTDIPAAWTRVGPMAMTRGLARMYASQDSILDVARFVDESDPRMANRGKTMQRELHEAAEQLRPTARTILTRASFAFMASSQYLVDRLVWIGSYEKHREAGRSHVEAVDLAFQDVIDTQGSGLIGDMPAVLREGGEFQKLFTTFMGFATRKLNLTAEATGRFTSNWRNPAEAARYGINMLLLWWLPGTIAWLAYGGLDDDEDPLAGIAGQTLAQGLSGLIFFRELSGFLQGYNDYRGPVGEGVFHEVGQFVAQMQQGEADEAAIKSTLTIASILSHIPFNRALESYRGFEAYMDGDAPATAIVTGPPRR